MLRRGFIILLTLTLLSCASAALGAQTRDIRFESAAVQYPSGEGAQIALLLSAPFESDHTVYVRDNRGGEHAVTFPAGETRAVIEESCALTASGRKTVYTLQRADLYARKSPYECTVTARAACMYAFSSDVYQGYVGNELKLSLRVTNGARLPAGTLVQVRDKAGAVLHEISHNPNRQSHSLSFFTNEAWRPGRELFVFVGERAQADSAALCAVGALGTKSIYGVRRDDNKISFTMDCGSGADNLPVILDILDAFDIKITFFVTGQFAQKNPDMVRLIAARGHEIGNHSWSHPSFYKLSNTEILSQLSRTNDLVVELAGVRPTLFRPPLGDCNSKIRAVVNAAGYEVIRWTHETYDSRPSASRANSLKYATKDVTGGSIILSHIDADCTVAVMEDIFTWYRENGFAVVPVSELLLAGDTGVDENGLQYALGE